MTPLSTPPAQCSTNWLTRLVCKVQEVLDVLCKKRVNFKLTASEQSLVYEELKQTLGRYALVFVMNPTSSEVFNYIDDWERKHQQTIVLSNQLAETLAPRLTIFNRIGLTVWKAFSIGTECSCCHGWRVLFLAAAAGSVGYFCG